MELSAIALNVAGSRYVVTIVRLSLRMQLPFNKNALVRSAHASLAMVFYT